jgi:hypothetical protein
MYLIYYERITDENCTEGMKQHKEEEASRQVKSNWAPTLLRPCAPRSSAHTGNALGVHNVAHVIPLHEEAWYMTISRKEAGPEK